LLAGKAREAVIMRIHNRNWEAAERIAQYYLKISHQLCVPYWVQFKRSP